MSIFDEKAPVDANRDGGEAAVREDQAKAARVNLGTAPRSQRSGDAEMSKQDANVTGFEQLPAVLTSREAARALRMGLKELRQLIERGELPAARLGPRRVIRIAKTAIVSLLGSTPRADAAPPSDVRIDPCKPVRRWKGRICQRD